MLYAPATNHLQPFCCPCPCTVTISIMRQMDKDPVPLMLSQVSMLCEGGGMLRFARRCLGPCQLPATPPFTCALPTQTPLQALMSNIGGAATMVTPLF